MIVIIDPKTMNLDWYPSLREACKYQKEWKYYTIRKKKLSYKPVKYKNVLWYRINYH